MTPGSSLLVIVAAAVMAFPAVLTSASEAQCVPMETVSVDQLLSIMKSLDLEAEDVSGEEGAKAVSWTYMGLMSRIALMKDGKFIWFYLILRDAPVTLQNLNDWNRESLFAKSYLDKDGDAVIELFLNFNGGICEGRIRDWFSSIRYSLTTWLDMMRSN
ncbi:MAG: YbjN domain-containing protein [Deltaproteobacteria bacterium]|jgi:hypothetical protein|nr:YbjN domain-containing protein [Deltaproteobacteria bacterium]